MANNWLLEVLGVEKKAVPDLEFQPGDLVRIDPDGRIAVVVGNYWEHAVEDWRYQVFLGGRLSISSNKVMKRVQ